MKRWTFILTFLFAISPLPASSATSIKPGEVCPKQGISRSYEGKVYSCNKAGNKLIWTRKSNRYVPHPKSSPPIIPSTQFIPWSIEISQELLVIQSNIEFLKWSKENHGEVITPTYVVDPRLEDADISWIKKTLSFAVKAFGSDSPSTYTVLIGKDCQWIQSIVATTCTDKSNNQYFSDSVSKGFLILQSVWEIDKLRPSDLQTATHEYFHTVQGNLSGGSNWPERVPSWFIEGGANFVGISFAELSGVSKYLDGRNEELLQRNYQYKEYVPLSEYSYLNVNPPLNYLNPYGIGCVATEYIVASVGMVKYLDIYRNLGQGKDFPSSFELATGISLNDFYKKFEIIRDRVGMPHGQ